MGPFAVMDGLAVSRVMFAVYPLRDLGDEGGGLGRGRSHLREQRPVGVQRAGRRDVLRRGQRHR